jgi:murein DD-endopeptidase MepM/ murein hydrolase activator NlpD
VSTPTGRWPWPVSGILTSPFGMRDGRQHAGVDIAAPTGTPIHAVIPGTISFVGQMDGYGNIVIVEHANGLHTRYAHMSRFGGFAVGDHVDHVDTIGFVGCTGHCSGPHVHFEVRTAPNDVPHDPMTYLHAA